jgi:branched-subunit amino acid transport protein
VLKLTVKVPALVESALTFVGVAAVTANVGVTKNVACEGAELRTPIPNAAIATSAMRLKFVFVDISFLSLVVTRNFPVAASR